MDLMELLTAPSSEEERLSNKEPQGRTAVSPAAPVLKAFVYSHMLNEHSQEWVEGI